jgi:hypothetical protein
MRGQAAGLLLRRPERSATTRCGAEICNVLITRPIPRPTAGDAGRSIRGTLWGHATDCILRPSEALLAAAETPALGPHRRDVTRRSAG